MNKNCCKIVKEKENDFSNKINVIYAETIIQLLQGVNPEMPIVFDDKQKEKIAKRYNILSQKSILENWPFIALNEWCFNHLSKARKYILNKSKDYDIASLGSDFWLYLTEPLDKNNENSKCNKDYILNSRYPASVLPEWFKRFLSSDKAPLPFRNPLNPVRKKLYSRFLDILKKYSEDFEKEGKSGYWKLKDDISVRSKQLIEAEALELLEREIGELQPVLWKGKEKADPLISGETGYRIAKLLMKKYGSVQVSQLASLTEKLLHGCIWIKWNAKNIDDIMEELGEKNSENIMGSYNNDDEDEDDGGTTKERYVDEDADSAGYFDEDDKEESIYNQMDPAESIYDNMIFFGESCYEDNDEPIEDDSPRLDTNDRNLYRNISKKIFRELGWKDTAIILTCSDDYYISESKWTYKQLNEWSKKHLPAEIKISNIDYRLKNKALPKFPKIIEKYTNNLMNEAGENAITMFIDCFREEGRRFLENPAYIFPDDIKK